MYHAFAYAAKSWAMRPPCVLHFRGDSRHKFIWEGHQLWNHSCDSYRDRAHFNPHPWNIHHILKNNISKCTTVSHIEHINTKIPWYIRWMYHVLFCKNATVTRIGDATEAAEVNCRQTTTIHFYSFLDLTLPRPVFHVVSWHPLRCRSAGVNDCIPKCCKNHRVETRFAYAA